MKIVVADAAVNCFAPDLETASYRGDRGIRFDDAAVRCPVTMTVGVRYLRLLDGASQGRSGCCHVGEQL